MKRSIIFSAAVLFTAFSLLISCNKKCDKTDPASECYESVYEKGVINGVKWATCNVDAHGKFAATPESYGMLYQWGRKGDGHEKRTSQNYPTDNTEFENGVVIDAGSFDATGQIVIPIICLNQP